MPLLNGCVVGSRRIMVVRDKRRLRPRLLKSHYYLPVIPPVRLVGVGNVPSDAASMTKWSAAMKKRKTINIKLTICQLADLTVYTVKYGKSNSNKRIRSLDQLVMTWQYNG